MTLPNQLTLARIVMVPFFVLLLSFDALWCLTLAYIVFTAAALTDYYDGKIARERGLITNFGKLLDPVADKILVSAAFVMMMTLPGLGIPAWTVIVVLAREFLVTGARSFAASEGAVIQASDTGKTKAVLQMVFVFVFLLLVIVSRFLAAWEVPAADGFAAGVETASLWAIVVVALYTVYSGVHFVWRNRRVLGLTGSQT